MGGWMANSKIIIFFLFIMLSVLISCNGSGKAQDRLQYRTIPEIEKIRPERPVRIKLKRSTKGNYSWELNGDDVDKIIEIDKKLRKSIGEDGGM